MNLLELENIEKAFQTERGEHKVLRGVSFVLPEYALKSLLGRSGSGKTTLLRICAGHERPDRGKAQFLGQPILAPSCERFLVYQAFDQLLPWLNIQDNILFALKRARKGISKKQAEEEALFWLSETGLFGNRSSYPFSLSGGMKQRAALARALALHPRLLLLDEPFSGLDAVMRVQMRTLLSGLCEKHGVSALFVTHDIEEALYFDASPSVLLPNGAGILTVQEGSYMREEIRSLLIN